MGFGRLKYADEVLPFAGGDRIVELEFVGAAEIAPELVEVMEIAAGASPQRVMLNVFRRAVWQVAAGVLVGSVLSAGFFVAIGLSVVGAMPLLLSVATIMALVALLATLGPTRRGLRVQAIEAMRAEA